MPQDQLTNQVRALVRDAVVEATQTSNKLAQMATNQVYRETYAASHGQPRPTTPPESGSRPS